MRIELEEVSLHYEQLGEGPDIVWVAGGGGRGANWHRWQIPFFEREFRNTTFDNRGIGETAAKTRPPWKIADMARDTAALIEAVCDWPVAVVGQSMGAMIVLELALARPDLLRCVVASGAAARGSEGWLGDYMRAEVELRRQGGRLDGMFALTHYAAELYPARALGDPELWETIKAWLIERNFVEDNEQSLIPQWQACIDFDVVERLPQMEVPLHVFAYSEDVQAPPQYGRQVADLVPGAEFHLFDGMGHGSMRGHGHELLNHKIREIILRHV